MICFWVTDCENFERKKTEKLSSKMKNLWGLEGCTFVDR